jgi:hypothetical protein
MAKTLSVGDQICWLAVSGATLDGRPVYRDWMSGTILGIELDGSYLVRRAIGGVCLVTTDVLARTWE